LCSKCHHAYKASITNRDQGNGCPRCAKVVPRRRETLADYPDVLALFDRRNSSVTNPGEVDARTQNEYDWLCPVTFSCGCRHGWSARVYNLTQNESGCPFCTRKRICKHQSFAHLDPEHLRLEWLVNDDEHPNPAMDTVAMKSNRLVWWQCRQCANIWQTRLSNRVHEETGCPECQSSKMERRLADVLTTDGVQFTAQGTYAGCVATNALRFDATLGAPLYAVIEADGGQHFRPNEHFGGVRSLLENQVRDRIKDRITLEHGIDQLRFSSSQSDNIPAITLAFVADVRRHRANPATEPAVRRWIGDEYKLLPVSAASSASALTVCEYVARRQLGRLFPDSALAVPALPSSSIRPTQ